MIYAHNKTKPGAGTPGFAQSTCRLVAFLDYRIGVASANAYMPLLSVALCGAERCAARLRGATS